MTPTPSQLLPYAAAAFAATTAALAAATYCSISPTNRLWGPVISHAPGPTTPHYALTFDDGPTPGATDPILDELRALNVQATFFVIGVNIERAPDLLRRIHNEGHLVANHSFHHSHYGMLRGPRYWHHELHRTNALIHQILGLRPTLFRPPMGVKTPPIHRAARLLGHHLVTWNRRAFDGIPTTTDRILSRLAPTTQPGDILMLHDGLEPHRHDRNPTATLRALRPLVDHLRTRKLTPVRLDTLLSLPPYHPPTP